jgi:membrane protein implicated in regulation of membrane protease activity
MEQFTDFLGAMTYWHWFALGAVLLIVEILTPTFFFIWFGIAAVLVGVLHLAVPGTSWQTSLTVFGALSIVSTVVWHAAYKKNGGPSPDSDLNQRARRYLGRRAVVAEAFRNGRGSILLDDTRWQALSEGGGDLDPGAAVEIVGADGATLRVRAA